jgi:hypothetical protein
MNSIIYVFGEKRVSENRGSERSRIAPAAADNVPSKWAEVG